MDNMSVFYQKKSKTEQVQAILAEIVECEKLLKSIHTTIVGGGGVVSGIKLGGWVGLSSICIFPDSNSRLHEKIVEAVKEYMDEIKSEARNTELSEFMADAIKTKKED